MDLTEDSMELKNREKVGHTPYPSKTDVVNAVLKHVTLPTYSQVKTASSSGSWQRQFSKEAGAKPSPEAALWQESIASDPLRQALSIALSHRVSRGTVMEDKVGVVRLYVSSVSQKLSQELAPVSATKSRSPLPTHRRSSLAQLPELVDGWH